jgi:low temperature requirement protein LtrA
MTNHHHSLWWGPPKKFDDRRRERKISWLELFYDLVYVAVISQLTSSLSENPGWSSLGFTFLLFSLLFWSWVNGSEYYDLHGSDGIRTRLLTFWQMLAVAAVAITIGDAYRGELQHFAIAFLFIQGIITYLWWSVGLYDPTHRVFNKFYTVNYVLAFAFLFISIFADKQLAIVLWIIVAMINLSPPLIGAKAIIRELNKRGQVFTATASIVERFGSFTIIVLAECILATVTGISSLHEKNMDTWLIFILAILISFLLWSIYFDMTSEQETKEGYTYMLWFVFLHFPLLAGFSALGASLKILLEDVDTSPPSIVKWLFCSSVSVILFMISALTRIMKENEEERSYIKPVSRLLILAAIFIMLIPFLAAWLKTALILGIVSVILFVPVLIGIRSWVIFKFSDGKKL